MSLAFAAMLLFTMLTVGLASNLQAVLRSFQVPLIKSTLSILLANSLLIPALVVIFIRWVEPNHVVSICLYLMAICACAPLIGPFAYIARDKVSWATALIGASAVLGLGSIPLSLQLAPALLPAREHFKSISLVLLLTAFVLPVLVVLGFGLSVNTYLPKFAARILKISRPLMQLSMLLTAMLILVAGYHVLPSIRLADLAILLAFTGVFAVVGAIVARAQKKESSILVGMLATGIRNFGVIGPLGNMLDVGPIVQVDVLAVSLVTLVSAFGIARFVGTQRISAKKHQCGRRSETEE